MNDLLKVLCLVFLFIFFHEFTHVALNGFHIEAISVYPIGVYLGPHPEPIAVDEGLAWLGSTIGILGVGSLFVLKLKYFNKFDYIINYNKQVGLL